MSTGASRPATSPVSDTPSERRHCSICNAKLYRRNTTDICYKHPERKSQYRKLSGRKCEVCFTPIEDRNRSRRCYKHINLMPNGDIQLRHLADQSSKAWAKLEGPRNRCCKPACNRLLRLDNTTSLCHQHLPSTRHKEQRAAKAVKGPQDRCHSHGCTSLLRIDNGTGFCSKHHYQSLQYRMKQRLRQQKHLKLKGERMAVTMSQGCRAPDCPRFRVMAGPFCQEHYVAWLGSFARANIARSVQRFLNQLSDERSAPVVTYSKASLEKMADALLGAEFTAAPKGDALPRAISYEDSPSLARRHGIYSRTPDE